MVHVVPDKQVSTGLKIPWCCIQELVVVGVWGVVQQEEAEVKYHSCLTLVIPLVQLAHGELVIYDAAKEEQIRIHLSQWLHTNPPVPDS